MKKLVSMFVVLLMAGQALPDIKFSGDSQFRLRYDINSKESSDKKTSDIYALYRAKLKVNANIGEGYFFEGVIGHNGLASWAKMGDGTLLPGTTATVDTSNNTVVYNSTVNNTAQAPSLSWMLLNFGVKKDRYGWAVGRYAMAGNNLTDIHYYPTIVVDLPFTINNNNGLTGAYAWVKLGPGALKTYVSMDENKVDATEIISSGTVTDQKDGMTLAMEYKMAFGDLSVTPMFLYSMENTTAYNPSTLGALLGYKIAGVDLQAAFGSTSEVNDNYKGYIARVGAKKKLGPGTLNGYYDIANVDWTDSGGKSIDYSFFWIDYAYTVVKTDMGSFTVKPTIRHSVKDDGTNADARTKLECTLDFKF